MTGRRKDLVIVAGRNHYPHDIEQTVAALSPAFRVGSTAAFGHAVDDEERLIVLQEIDRSARDHPELAGLWFDGARGGLIRLLARYLEERRRGTSIVATGDRDAYQLASETTTILQPIRAGEMARIGPAEVRKRYDVEPRQVPDFIAIRGDASDRIPGAIGIGAVGAATLLRKYGSLEKAIAAGRLASQADKLRLYRTIATMDKSAPLPVLRNQKPTWSRAAGLARDWQLNRLADRLDALA